ncbi:MAG: enoyl-CoA hydratase/isomerase family protein [Actinomycetota bacterium]|nr:enoyl-CoA hydratase/isomerase family protein [Actinomycetota bacterium]
MSNLVVERRGDATWVGIDRPEARNALDRATIDALHEAIGRATAGGPSVLVIHSTTAGTFVAGADIAELAERGVDDALEAINIDLFERIGAYRWPTIAAIDGPALGGGCELALACDLRVATPRARFAQPEPALGIIAGAGANWRLAQLAGIGVARRMLYLGETLDALAALSAGLVDRVVEEEELGNVVDEMVGAIAGRSWRATELTKLALRQHRPDTTAFDMAAQALLFESDDKADRMGAFLARRNRPRTGS